MMNNEDWRATLEREGISDFILARTYSEENGYGVFQTTNGFYFTIFRLTPAPYVGQETAKKLTSFFSINFPANSVLQFMSYAGRNVREMIDKYSYIHSPKEKNQYNTCNIKNPEMIDFLAENKVEWLKKYSNESILEKANLELYLRDFINLAVVMIPMVDTDGNEIKKSELLQVLGKAKNGLKEFSPRNFNQKDYIKFMREILNPSFPMWHPPVDTSTFLNNQISDVKTAVEIKDSGAIAFGKYKSGLESQVLADTPMVKKVSTFFRKMFKLGYEKFEDSNITPEWYANVLTTKMFPTRMELTKASDIFTDYLNDRPSPLLPMPHLVSLTIKVEDKQKIVDDVQGDAKWNMWQLEYAGKAANFMPVLKDRAVEAKNIIDAINQNGEIPMRALWSLTIFADDEEKLERYTNTTIKEFMENNWMLQKEIFIQLPVLLFSLPGQFDEIFYSWSKRFSTLFKANNAAITPLMTDSKGIGNPVLMYIGRNGQLQGIDLFDKSASSKNFVVIAPTGKGKSYLTADLFTQYAATGAKIRIIDSGESYLRLCINLGGQYIRFEENNKMCLNFFTELSLDNETGLISEEELESMIPLIGMMAQVDLEPKNINAEEDLTKQILKTYISKAIKDAFASEENEAGMKDVYDALKTRYDSSREKVGTQETDSDTRLRDLIIALEPYSLPTGEYFRYFNGRKNLDFNSDFVVLEMKELEQKGNIKNVVLMAVSHIITREFYFDNLRKKKILAIDEAWSLLSNPIVARFVEGLYRKARKFNGSIGVITQSINDFYKNDSFRILFENAHWRFFLQQEPDSLIQARDNKRINLDDFSYSLLRSIETINGLYSEIMVKTSAGHSSVGRLIVSRFAHWMYTNADDDTARILDTSEKYNITEAEAARAIGFSEDNNTDVVHEINKIKEKGYESTSKRKLLDDILSFEENE
jgi:conjugal transfer ATP-binding protein TraC